MIGRVVDWSLRHRLLVTLGVLALVVAGVRGFLTLPMDAVPDVTNVQVQVLSTAPGLSPLEVEQLVTRPIELAMFGTPGLRTVRSVSRTAVSAVTVVFDDDTDPQLARTLVAQRLTTVRESVAAAARRSDIGPFTTGLGEVYHFTLRWQGHDIRELRTAFDWEIANALRAVPGVVEVNAWGGRDRQIEVRMRPSDMTALGVSASQLESALLGGGKSAGGGSIERGQDQVAIRFDGQYRTAKEIADQVVATRSGGQPVRVSDVANIVDGEGFRTAAATADGEGETVYGMVQMIAGGNAASIVAAVKSRLAELTPRLPAGLKIEPFYDRAAFVDRVLGTVKRSLAEGVLVVVLALFAFLGEVAAGLVVATTIPLAMLGAFALMAATGMSGNLMSLGAIDFGLVVDGAVVVVEGALATMTLRKMSAGHALAHEGRTVGGPIAFGVFIIALVYAPVLLLSGLEGKMFRPMAWTVLFALGTAFVLSFTWVPVLASVALRKAHTTEPWLVRLARRGHAPMLAWMLRRRGLALAAGVAALVAGGLALRGRGAEFAPRLEEGDLVVQVTRAPNVSLTEAIAGTTDIERTLLTFPEVERVVSRTGSPDVATDVMGVEQSDVFVLLRRDFSGRSREQLASAMEKALRTTLPGTSFSFSQPIDMRFSELIGGVKSDVGIKISGSDIAVLTRLAGEVSHTLSTIRGATDVRAEQTAGLTIATVRPDPLRAGRLGIANEQLRSAVELMRAGRTVGQLLEGERRFDVTLRVATPPAASLPGLGAAPILADAPTLVRVGDVAQIDIADGPSIIGREQARRRVLVEANVRGRDLAGFVTDTKRALAGIALPQGYELTLSGQYEHLEHASRRLAVIVPLTLIGILLLLYSSFVAARPALLIFLNVPIAASGGLVALAMRGMPLSLSAAVGFIALFGVATLNGVVLLSAIVEQERHGAAPSDAAAAAAAQRMRPVLTTAVVAALGFIPMMLAHGPGAEVQRPLATVVVGGIVSASALTLLILPALWVLTAPRRRDVAGSQTSQGAGSCAERR